jgi:molybdopterin-binding protein
LASVLYLTSQICHFTNVVLLTGCLGRNLGANVLGYLTPKGSESMEISARNTLKGRVKTLTPGAVNTEVAVEVAPGVEMVAVITKASAETLGLDEGKEVYVVVKASDVMIATD